MSDFSLGVCSYGRAGRVLFVSDFSLGVCSYGKAGREFCLLIHLFVDTGE